MIKSTVMGIFCVDVASVWRSIMRLGYHKYFGAIVKKSIDLKLLIEKHFDSAGG